MNLMDALSATPATPKSEPWGAPVAAEKPDPWGGEAAVAAPDPWQSYGETLEWCDSITKPIFPALQGHQLQFNAQGTQQSNYRCAQCLITVIHFGKTSVMSLL